MATRPAARPAYRPRVVDAELVAALAAAGAVLIEGPKACGKTATARQIVASEVRLDVDPTARAAAAVDPSLVLDGPVPRLIDEWQLEPDVWIRDRVDRDATGEPVALGVITATGLSYVRDDNVNVISIGTLVP